MDDLPVSAALFTIRKDRDAFEDWKKKSYTQIKLYLSLNNIKSEVIWPSSLILGQLLGQKINFYPLLKRSLQSFPLPAGPRLLPASVGLQ